MDGVGLGGRLSVGVGIGVGEVHSPGSLVLVAPTSGVRVAEDSATRVADAVGAGVEDATGGLVTEAASATSSVGAGRMVAALSAMRTSPSGAEGLPSPTPRLRTRSSPARMRTTTRAAPAIAQLDRRLEPPRPPGTGIAMGSSKLLSLWAAR